VILVKLQTLSQYDPQEAIVVATKLLERKLTIEKERHLGNRLAEANALYQGGHVASRLQHWSDIEEEYGPFRNGPPGPILTVCLRSVSYWRKHSKTLINGIL
jgi:prepilin-type processing-associated H-X9-DG protein